MKIIIADDQADTRAMVQSILSKQGFEVIGDATGEIINRLERDLPDLIILDINLQNKDGGDICTKLKSQRHTKNIPILLISGIMDLKQISQFCGAEDWLIKPFTTNELEEKVKQYLIN
jgi:DNA-binding response OmpR family regulator